MPTESDFRTGGGADGHGSTPLDPHRPIPFPPAFPSSKLRTRPDHSTGCLFRRYSKIVCKIIDRTGFNPLFPISNSRLSQETDRNSKGVSYSAGGLHSTTQATQTNHRSADQSSLKIQNKSQLCLAIQLANLWCSFIDRVRG
ncbi:hypothetical protein PGT21_034791 [Puccinia graminis f. sp. tritici]|uniref:Uncharacterized protein n=1 Tax=Puccinia graminis f. sp. tritici TaxID=56615 RepID=A0A5B0R457_PUCGR|nr:hypothetical protein PGT21_034791 [Puccinia graminis f. sp. tritici]KAA1120278.1 hypothetical protein PGTUg99_004731 [Puccinia graminis f. sp. tritici]